MNPNVFAVTENKTLMIRPHSNLRLIGWERMEVSIDTDLEPMRVEQGPDLLRLVCFDDVEVFVPAGMKVVVEKTGGELRAANLTGDLAIEKVGGSLSLQKVGKVQIGRVGGNCKINGASAAVTIEKIGGDLDAIDIEGGLLADSIGGELTAASVKVVLSARAGGSIQAALSDLGAANMALRAGGDIHLQLPSDTSGSFELISGGEDIRIHLDGRVEEVGDRNHQFSTGTGPTFAMRAGGCIYISDQPIEYETKAASTRYGWEERLNRRIQNRVQAAQRGSDWAERVERLTQDAINRAEERVNAAMDRVEAKGRSGWHSSFDFIPQVPVPPAPPAPPTPAVPPKDTAGVDVENQPANEFEQERPVESASTPPAGVSDEERLLVLRMLQEKKITVEQAEELMETLESGEVTDDQA